MSAKMDALQFDVRRLKLSQVKVDLPTRVEDDGVIVEVAYAGVCGTDLHILEGKFPCSPNPVILGHEFCGIAIKVGPKVTHIEQGDRVAVDPSSGCNTCCDCSNGCYHYCKTGGIDSIMGMWSNGGWAQYCVVPASQVYKIPDNIALEQAVLTEPLSCIVHGWDRIIPLPVGSRVLILGAGIIGNLWACILHLQGHKHVTISEPQAGRRELVEKLGLGYACVTPQDLKAKQEADPEWGFDLVIDCSGHAPAMEEAVTYVKSGGKLAIFGVASPDKRISVSPYLMFKKELTILAMLLNPFSFPKSLSLIEAMGSRYLDYEKLGIKVFSLSQYHEAVTSLKKGTISKAVFKVK